MNRETSPLPDTLAAVDHEIGTAALAAPALPVGTSLQGGAFILSNVLGRGSCGITYKGVETQSRRQVAIKELLPLGSQRQQTVVRLLGGVEPDAYALCRRAFIQEAMTLTRFDHTGMVRVSGAFQENNTAYMVMELLQGQSLQERLETTGVLGEAEALRLVKPVCEALALAHEAKLLHRDIRPHNILLVAGETAEGGNENVRAVLTDFGTAREFVLEKSRARTEILTSGYAPAEQYYKQAKLGPSTDVYALGATLYHCLTGQVPVSAHERRSGVELLSPVWINPKVSRPLSDAIMWAMEIKAPERPQSIGDFLHAIQGMAPAGTEPGAFFVEGHFVEGHFVEGRSASQVQGERSNPQAGGTSQPDLKSKAQPLCRHCGAAMTKQWLACPRCHKYKDDPITTSSGEAVSNNVSNALVIWIVICVALFGLFVYLGSL